METRRLPQSEHEKDDASAPEDLELLRGFLSLHDHLRGDPDSLPPSADSLRWWLETHGLVEASEVDDRDLGWALEVRDALLAGVREQMGSPRDDAAARVLDRAVEESGLRISFDTSGNDPVRVGATGVRGAIGSLLGRAFLARLDDRWDRFRICRDPGCGSVFYDRSSNRTGKWCSMASCGNRNKVRAFRERQAAG